MRLLIIILSLIVAFFVGCIVGEEGIIAQAGHDRQLEVIEVEVTAYSPSKHITDSNPWETASQLIVTPQDLEQVKYVALSRDLLKEYNVKYGDKIWISFEVQDKMGQKATQGIDIFFRNLDLARKFGRQVRTIIIERR